MKRIILTITASVAILMSLSSQNIDDALRYSQTFYNGTARFVSMSGAFTALGADLSAISQNPAGAGMFRSYEFSFSPQLQYHNTSSVFNSTSSKDYRYSFGLGNAGVVGNIMTREAESGLINLNFAYSYTNTNLFYENSIIKGVSNNSSMADYWALNSEGTYYKNLGGSAGIAYDAWVIDTITGTGASSYGTIFSAYGDNTVSTYGQTIRRAITNEGYQGEHTFTIAGNVSDKIFFGASLGITSLRYMGHYEHLEADYDNVITDFKNFTYIDHFDATGTGYSMKFGFLFRPVDILRIGGSIHTPVIYRIHEYFYDNITSAFDNNDTYSFENDPLRYSYTLTTPLKYTVGASVQIGKLGIVSADFDHTDYSMSRFSRASDGYNYTDENQSIKDILKASSSLRLGAELRLNNIYLRGGYGIITPAFVSGESNEDLSYNNFSGGIGFRQQSFFIDFAFASLNSTRKYYMYNDPPYLQPATIKSAKTTFTTTFGFRF